MNNPSSNYPMGAGQQSGIASREYAEKLNAAKVYEVYADRPYAENDTLAAPITPIAGGAMRMRNHAEQIQAMVSELERKISPILRPEAPQPATDGGAQVQAARPAHQSDFAKGLQSHADSLELVIAYLGNLIDRVEL